MAKFTDGSGVSRLWTRIQTLISNAISAIRFHGDAFYSTDATNVESITTDCNAIVSNGHFYYTTNGPSTSIGATATDGALYVQAYSPNWVVQIAQDYRTGRLFTRTKANGNWQAWTAVPKSSDLSAKMDVDGGNAGSDVSKGIAFGEDYGFTTAIAPGAFAEGGVNISYHQSIECPTFGDDPKLVEITFDTSCIGYYYRIGTSNSIPYCVYITPAEYLATPTDSTIKEVTENNIRATFIAKANGKMQVQLDCISGSMTRFLYEDRLVASTNQANFPSSHAEGSGTCANGDYSHAEGVNTCAKGTSSHAEGGGTYAIGSFSHAEGNSTCASGQYSHAEGHNTTASGQSSHAEGDGNQAGGYHSHAGGTNSITDDYAQGSFVHANNGIAHNAYQVLFGKLKTQANSPTYSTVTKNSSASKMISSLFSIGYNLINHSNNSYGDPPHNSTDQSLTKLSTNAVLDLDCYGNMFLTGHIYKARGKIVGQLVANGRNITLDKGAIYVLYVAGWVTSTSAFRGINAYVIAAGLGTSTTALAAPKIASIGTTGTVCCKLSSTYSGSSSPYGSVLGIGCCTTAITIRYTLQKVSGSTSDFDA